MKNQLSIITGLLLAATLAVDVVTLYRLRNDIDGGATWFLIYYALVFAELSILSVWAVILAPTAQLRWLVPLVAGVLFVLLLASTTNHIDPPPEAMLAATLVMWGHVIVCLSLLWLLKPSRWLVQWADRAAHPKWQFGTAHLLILITLVAVVSFMVRKAEHLLGDRSVLMAVLIGNGTLLLSMLIVRSNVAHWFMRLAGSFAAALLIGVVCRSLLAVPPGFNFYAFYLVQAAMCWAWIEVLFPQRASAESAQEVGLPETVE